MVVHRLALDERWQAELNRLGYVQQQLKREMPAFGYPVQGQLAGLLPTILDNARRRRGPLANQPDRFQTGMVVFVVLLLLIMIPLLIEAQSSVFAAASIGNVPHATHTPALAKKSTFEAQFQTYAVFQVSIGTGLRPADDKPVGSSERTARLSMAASPVPAPGATLQPSLQAAKSGH
jgi:hypothetical protein